jgi:hypothetical protein
MDYNTKALNNYQFLLSLPIVVELIKKNKKLRKENKSLKNLICSIPEFRCKCSNSNINITNKGKKLESLRKSVSKITETYEKNIILNTVKTEKIDDSDDGVVFIEEIKKNVTPNIVYVLDEELEDGEIREEEVVEEDEELEEVVEEEEEEEEVVEEEEEEEEVVEEEEEVVEEEEEVVEEEEEVVEEEEEVVEEEEEVVEEEEEEVLEEVEGQEEEEVFEIEIKGKSYYTTNETNGVIYNIVDNEEIGEEIGKFENGKPIFYKK